MLTNAMSADYSIGTPSTNFNIRKRHKRSVEERISYLENVIAKNTNTPFHEGEEEMAKKNRIRRELVINGVKRWVTGDTEQEYAENIVKITNAHAVSVQTVEPCKHLFRSYADNWFTVFSKPNVAEVTAITYERQLRLHIYPVIGDMFIEDVKAVDVQNVFNSMPKNTKTATKQKVSVVMSQIFKYAFDEDIIRKNPMESPTIRIKGMPSEPTEEYSIETMRTIIGYLPTVENDLDRRFVALLALLPLRMEEALGLKWEDIDFETGRIHIRRAVTQPERNQPLIKETKTTASKRYLSMAKEMYEFLLPIGKPDEFVLGGAEPLSTGKIDTIYRHWRKLPGIPSDMNSRRFRTTLIADIQAELKDIKAAQAAAGHTSPLTTIQHYLRSRRDTSETAACIVKLYEAVN